MDRRVFFIPFYYWRVCSVQLTSLVKKRISGKVSKVSWRFGRKGRRCEIRDQIQELDPAMPVYEMKMLGNQLDETLGPERLTAMHSAGFGVLATLLAAVGLNGVMALMVVRRTKEVGLRMAPGAPQGAVLCMVMKEALCVLEIGLAAGLPCAYSMSRYVSSQLFGVPPTDIRTVVAASLVPVAVAAAAGLLPARRASLIDPIQALRHE
jgi:predicted lysophospholipase L1 biosynthesis ABC-type transport system permease subunit